jgi:hypothetical protein
MLYKSLPESSISGAITDISHHISKTNRNLSIHHDGFPPRLPQALHSSPYRYHAPLPPHHYVPSHSKTLPSWDSNPSCGRVLCSARYTRWSHNLGGYASFCHGSSCPSSPIPRFASGRYRRWAEISWREVVADIAKGRKHARNTGHVYT